ncbi:hypothetical protein [Streptomyces bluensis]|uniref:hypothetical protein n=1 Tax=Streptomyces bluensis TaxID=33897 RepID=UPI00331B4011
MSRPARFAAVDNEAIDALPSILAVGLLTRLIRAKDGDDVTVESLSQDYDEGEKALSKAMRMLVDHANVVKFKIQRATTETVLEDGREVVKRGGSWYTTFSVDSVPFTAEDVAQMLEDIYAEGNVKCHRVEPTRLDPRGRAPLPAPRPTPPKGGVGATCGNDAKPQGRPEPPRAGVGQGGAHIRKETTYAGDEEMGDALSARSAVDGHSPSTTCSSAREAEGGSAASSKDDPSPNIDNPTPQAGSGSSTSRHTKQQLDLVRAVRAHFPPDLLNGWKNPSTGQVIPPLPDVPALSQAILDALDGDGPASDRTVEQLAARIEQRWNHHGWGEKYYAGQIDRLVGAAVAMVRPLKASDRYGCANPRCEAGKDADTGTDCPVCPKRMEDRRQARRKGVPAPRDERSPQTGSGGRVHRECACRNPIPKSSDDTMCRDCRKHADTMQLAAQGPAPF